MKRKTVGVRPFIYFLLAVLTLFLAIPQGYYVLDAKTSQTPPHQDRAFEAGHVGLYLINLDRSPDRLAYALKSLQELPWPSHRISGVDGSKFTDDDIRQHANVEAYRKYMGKPPEKGTIGCSLSHMKAWQTFLASTNEYALIFEDDISFDPAHLKQTVSSLLTMPQKWDLVNLENRHRALTYTRAELPGDVSLVAFLTPITHAGAYLLNRKAAKNLLKYAKPILMPVDHYFTREWELGFKFSGVLPNIVHHTHGTSQISGTKLLQTQQDSEVVILRHLERTAFRVQSDIIRFFVTTKNYLSEKLS